MSSYRDLKVYQKSYEVAKTIYKDVCPKLPNDEQYGLVSQLKRAATSIPLNIAEGYGKYVGGKELVRFLVMARGSCSEMSVLIDFIKDFEFINENQHNYLIKTYDEVGKMITGLIHSINKKENHQTNLITNN